MLPRTCRTVARGQTSARPMSLIVPIVLCVLLFGSGCGDSVAKSPTNEAYQPREGDILFQSSPHGRLVDAIEGATNSPYSHCGMVVERDGRLYVIEGAGPVLETPIAAWTRRGRGARYDAYRVDGNLVGKIPAVVKEARKYLGRPYDIRYRMDDEKIYCSELVYKAFLGATGQRVGQLKTLGELKWQPFEELIREIEGAVPLDRKIITPAAVARAPQLRCVYRSLPTGDEK